jgi:hypothetical protein
MVPQVVLVVVVHGHKRLVETVVHPEVLVVWVGVL